MSNEQQTETKPVEQTTTTEQTNVQATENLLTTKTENAETNTATTSEGWPVTSNNWFHLLNSTHSNTANYYSMQFAGDFFNQNGD